MRDTNQVRVGQTVMLAGQAALLEAKEMLGPAVVWHRFNVGPGERLYLTGREVQLNLSRAA